ncbi:hypothetical protein [Deinococcus sedimenti]|uniref:Uncharacterized protein n=1 Tax=Deinococcus sedimenti TaxID=1867090 RepID=A0ABQ2S6V3_9DEIO|nr:hypothetical protein [Deinococcus sedimenti]GGS03410.1 hypothetical protein GCM10008960_32540 [Deinococcus sedimenti]
MPSLAGVRPLVLQADLDAAERMYEEGLLNDPVPLVTPLLGTVLPDPGPDGPLDQRLQRALSGVRTDGWTLNVQNERGLLHFRGETDVSCMVDLHRLHAALWPVDRHLLPGLLFALEVGSSRVTPVVGPHSAAAICEQHFSLEHLAEYGLPDRLDRPDLVLTERDAMRAARRLGIPHGQQVQDALPWPYFRALLSLEDTLARLERVLPRMPALGPLLTLLPELRAADDAFLPPTDDEWSDVVQDPIPHTLLTVTGREDDLSLDTVNEFLQNHWECGNVSPQWCVQVGLNGEGHDRLAAYLQHAPRVAQLAAQCVGVLDFANRSLPARRRT